MCNVTLQPGRRIMVEQDARLITSRFDTLAAESIEAVFQAVLTAATQDGDMAAAKLLIDSYPPAAGRQYRSTFGR
jgi:hypothetical protein